MQSVYRETVGEPEDLVFMDTRRALIFLAVMVVIVIVVMVIALQPQPSCCTPPPEISATASAIIAVNHAVETAIEETAVKSTVYPYEPTLYAQRRQEERNLETGAGPTQYAAFFATESALIATYQGTVVPTVTVHPTTYSACSWQWANQNLPDVASKTAETLNSAGIVTSDLRVSAYGENCYDNLGKLQYFAAMTTDFYLTIEVNDLTDDTLAAKLIASYEALNALSDLPAKPGYLDIAFVAGSSDKHIRTMFDQIQVALDKGLTASELILAFSSH